MLKTDFPTQFWTIHFDPLIAQLRSETIQNVNVDLFTQASELFWLKGKKIASQLHADMYRDPRKTLIAWFFPHGAFSKKV